MKRLLYLLPLLFVLAAPACAGKARHTAVVADSALYEVLNSVHQAEQTALCGQPSCAGVPTAPTVPGWTEAKSQAFNKKLLPAVEGGRQFNRILATVKAGDPLPDAAKAVIQSVSDALAAVTSDFPDGTTKTALLANIGKAQSLILAALQAVLSVKG